MWQQNEDQRKNKILSVIQSQGPSLPVRVASVTQIPPLFASAFLSELIAEGKIKTSNLRVGSSPLYYLPGQEAQLENFFVHLNQREKEAFQYLKQNGLVNEEELTPVLRVAMKEIKDFAIPMQFQLDGMTKTFWRFFLVGEDEAREKITLMFSPKKKEESKVELKLEEKKEVKRAIEEKFEVEKEDKEEEVEVALNVNKVKLPKQKETEFGNSIREYLVAKDIELIEAISEKKKEMDARVRLDSMFGKQQYYLIAKDKKSVTDNDLSMALQKSQMHKMPALVVSGGELNKKAKEYLEHWGNLVKFEKIE